MMRRLNKPRSEGGLPTAIFAVAFALGLAMSPGTGHSTINVRDLWAPDGEVRAIVHANNTLYLGGSFSHVGPVSGPAVALDLGTALAQTPYPKVSRDVQGVVYAVEPDGSGGWYIGGTFTSVQGHRRNNLAQIDADGQATSWNPDLNGFVNDIAVEGGVVYLVGVFTRVGTVTRNGIAAVNAATGVATHWNPFSQGAAYEVEVGGGKVYLAGQFVAISGEPRPCLAEFTEVVPGDQSTGALTGLFAGSDANLTHITALEVADGKLLYAAQTVTFECYLKVYDLSAGSFLPYSVTSTGVIEDVALDPANGIFFVGGDFGSVNAVPRVRLAALDLATGFPTPWRVDVNETVQTLALAPNGLLVGGNFTMLGTMPRRGLGLVDPLSPTVLGWDAGCIGAVIAVEADGTRAYAGGQFSIINAVPRTNLAAIDETSGAALDWNPTTNASVEALAVSGSTVYVGGQFSMVNGITRNRAAAVDAATGVLTGFNPNVDVSGPTTVKTFAISGNTMYMGGVFGTVRNVERVGIAAVNATTGALFTWNPFSDGSVNSISFVPGGIFGGPILVVGGDFTIIGGAVRNYLATLDSVTAVSGGLDSPNGPVYSVCVEPLPPGYGGFNQIFIGGAFTSVAGQPRNHIASLAAFGLVTSWDPNANGVVYSIARVGDMEFVGGAFTTIGAQARTGIAAIDASGMATIWDPDPAGGNPPGGVYSLLESGGTLYAGGTFTSIAETPHSHFAGMGEVVTAVETEPVPGVTPSAPRAAPNPFDQSTKILFSLVKEGETRVTVYDVGGRRVRKIHSGWLSSGRHTMSWDGRDDSGRPVAAGVYFLGVRTQAGSMGSKIYRVK